MTEPGDGRTAPPEARTGLAAPPDVVAPLLDEGTGAPELVAVAALGTPTIDLDRSDDAPAAEPPPPGTITRAGDTAERHVPAQDATGHHGVTPGVRSGGPDDTTVEGERMTSGRPPGERRAGRRSDPASLPPGVADRRVPTEIVGLLGVGVAALTAPRALAQVSSMIERGAVGAVAFANAHLLTVASDRPEVREALRAAAIILNDGAGVAWAARTRGKVFPENLNGTDFTPLLLERAQERLWRVAMLGAQPGVAERAAVALRERFPDLRICYVAHGYFDPADSSRVAAEIRATEPDLLLVAMGNPVQELWLHRHLTETGAHVGVAIGAFFDFAAGEVPRAPRWMRAARLEWLFRLLLEPRRLFSRYVIGIPVFARRVRRDALRPTPVHPQRRREDRTGSAADRRSDPGAPRREGEERRGPRQTDDQSPTQRRR